MSTVEQGMTTDQVLSILGEPDDVRTEHDRGGFGTTRTKEVWCYGADRHMSFPTLGCVYIDERNESQYIYGGSSEPPAASIVPERQLRSILAIIDRLPAFSIDRLYTFKDGTFLPDRTLAWTRHLWHLPVRGMNAKLMIERYGWGFVDVSLSSVH